MEEKILLPSSWQGWEITECIGQGSYGSVYAARFLSDAPGEEEQLAAVKIISLPSDEAEAAAVARDHPDKKDQIAFYEGVIDSLLEEIHTMERLRDDPNAVTLQDYHISHEEDLKWTICIRMELLTPFSEYQVYEEMEEADVIRLGIDICSVLEDCAKQNIIHRDIKPENIMADQEGHFKLGDFGIARKLEQTAGEMSLKGTFTYMAPEVYHGEQYDVRADQYSLGIVLYRIMNNNRDPLISPDVQMVSYKEKEEALRERMAGEVLPDPADASRSFGRIIRKACAFRPENRFASVSEMKDALERCLRGEDFDITNLVEISEAERQSLIRQKQKKKRIALAVIIAAAAAVFIGVFVFLTTRKTEDELWIGESRETESMIKETGLVKDNALTEYDLSAVSEELGRINGSPEAENVLEKIRDYEAGAKEPGAGEEPEYENSAVSLFYLDDDKALGLAVSYSGVLDENTQTERVRDQIILYYLTREDGDWVRNNNSDIPQTVWESVYETCLPKGFTEAYRSGRNCYDYLDGYWAAPDAYYLSNLLLYSGAIWQNEDGSVDVYMICRNGTEHTGAEYSYWTYFGDDEAGDVVKAWGHLDPGAVTVDAESIKGYLVHFDADEVLSGTKEWSDAGLWNYTAGNNSNYE